MKTFLASAIVFFISLAGLTACNSSSSEGRAKEESKANTNASQNNSHTAAQNFVETKKTPATDIKPTEDLPAFKIGEDYKSSVRVKMLRAGWEPFHAADAQTCEDGDRTCEDFPEMENCAGTGLGNCKFLWRREGKSAAIYTVGVPPVFSSYGYEKSPPQ